MSGSILWALAVVCWEVTLLMCSCASLHFFQAHELVTFFVAAVMADPGLVTSGSLTDKELQWTSTASGLGRTDSPSLTDRDGHRELISEMKQVLNASGILELREWIAALQESMMNMEMLVATQTSKMVEMTSVVETISANREPSKVTSTAGTLPGTPVKPSPDRPSEDPMPLHLNLNVNHQLKSSHSSKPSRFNASDSEEAQPRRKSFGSKSESLASKVRHNSWACCIPCHDVFCFQYKHV